MTIVADTSCDLAIIGAGPTGLYAAYYSGFRGFSTVVIDALPELGGQITAMYPEKEIFDVGGFPSITGRELVEGLTQQAQTFDPTFILGEQAISLEESDDGLVITTDAGSTIHAKVLLISSGIGSFKPRPMPQGEEWVDRGVVYFVPRLSEHADRDVVIVGGGDSAFDWAWSLRDIAKSITLVHRREEFRAHAATVDKVRAAGIQLITSAEVSAVRGGDQVEEIDITRKGSDGVITLPAQTVVAALGFVANLGPLADWGLELDKRHLVVDTTMATSRPRVYAAGDIATYPGKVALISVGFSEAALAVNNAAPIIDPTHGIFPGHSSGGSN